MTSQFCIKFGVYHDPLLSKGTNETFIIINTYFASVQDHNPALDVCKINIGILNIGSWMNSL